MSTPETRKLAHLLDSMSADAPRSGAKRATLSALGLGSAAVATTGTAGAVGGIGGLAKLAATGALCGFATGGAVLGVRYALAPEPPDHRPFVVTGAPASAGPLHEAVPGAAPTGAPSGQAVTPSTRPDTPTTRMDLEAFKSAENAGSQALEDGRRASDSSAVATFPASPSATSSLREETSQLDRARAAIFAGNAGAGLVALDRYAAAFPRGALAQEAALLRIKALVMRGDRAEARALARSFIASRPRDPHVQELRSLLEP
jgi:hypothetical protein